MGFFDRFRKRKQEPTGSDPETSSTLSSLCYGIAYFVMPHYAFNDFEKLRALFVDTPTAAGPFFYMMGCEMQKKEPVRDDAVRFRSEHGELDEAHEFFILEYPTPPPFDLTGQDLERVMQERRPVLAPYFSAVIRHRETSSVRYFVLGQAPFGGGTTLRSVSADGVNANLGPGPASRLDEFVARLRQTKP